jgi:WD40 repeat protein
MFVPEGGARAVQFWDWRSGTRRGEPIATPTEPRSLAFSPAGDRLAVACADGRIVLLDPESRRVQHRLDTGLRIRPFTPNLWLSNGAVRFSPDGRLLLSWENNHVAQIWDVSNGRKLFTLTHDDLVWEGAFHPSGRYLAIGSLNNIHIWDLESGQPARTPLEGSAVGVCFQGNILLTTCGDGTIAAWDWKSGRMLSNARFHTSTIQNLAFTADGRWTVSGAIGDSGLFDRSTGTPASPPLLLGQTSLGVCVTPDGHRATFSGFDTQAVGLDLATMTTPAAGDAADLVRTAELLAGARTDDSGGLTWLSAAEWQERWRWYQTRQPVTPWPESPQQR